MRLFGPLSNKHGDTIVEVLISLLIISAILVGAFVLSHTSSRNVRDSQEHAEALGQLQAQVELLRTAAGVDGTLSSAPATFCMSDDAQPLTASDTACTKSERYKMTITADDLTASTTTFSLNVSWDRLGGGTGSEDLVYRVAVH